MELEGTEGLTAAVEAPRLQDFKREIQRLHGCDSVFERFVTLPQRQGRPRRVVAVFALKSHPARRCYVWLESARSIPGVVAVLHGIDTAGPEDAVRYVAAVEQASTARWAQEYA